MFFELSLPTSLRNASAVLAALALGFQHTSLRNFSSAATSHRGPDWYVGAKC
jgi:hypothetical protein